ncbi:hypothetical protein A167_03155 [Alcanivorax sp. S71-1-4]|jgi:hypothetical protein|nr:hypothetical protein A167_03155 [Alcanivorax sp. S71-1-4]
MKCPEILQAIGGWLKLDFTGRDRGESPLSANQLVIVLERQQIYQDIRRRIAVGVLADAVLVDSQGVTLRR